MLLRGERRLSALILLGLRRRLSALSFFFFSPFFPPIFLALLGTPRISSQAPFGAQAPAPLVSQPGAFRRTSSGLQEEEVENLASCGTCLMGV